MKKSLFFYFHSISGLISGIFILLISLSGSILVFHEELDRFQQPSINSSADNQKIMPVDCLYFHLQNKYPSALISSLNLPAKNTHAPAFTLYDSSYKYGAEAMQVLMHPVSGEILKTRGGGKDLQNNFMSWLSVFHNSFHLGKKGEWLLGVFSIAFLVSLITGIVLYRKTMLSILLMRRSAYRKNNLHQVFGTWALLFNLLIAITGLWMQRYVFKKEFYSNETWVNTIKPTPPLLFDFESAYRGAIKLHPGFSGRVIYFPQSSKGKTAIYGSRSSNNFIHSKKFADVIFLDSTGKVAKTAFVDSIDASSRYDIINAQLHYGQYGGFPVKIIYGLMGLSGGLLSVTGFLLWFKTRRSNR